MGYENIQKGAIPRSEKTRIPFQGSRSWEKIHKFEKTLGEQVILCMGKKWKYGHKEFRRIFVARILV